jgi:hypothetical protein
MARQRRSQRAQPTYNDRAFLRSEQGGDERTYDHYWPDTGNEEEGGPDEQPP